MGWINPLRKHKANTALTPRRLLHDPEHTFCAKGSWRLLEGKEVCRENYSETTLSGRSAQKPPQQHRATLFFASKGKRQSMTLPCTQHHQPESRHWFSLPHHRKSRSTQSLQHCRALWTATPALSAALSETRTQIQNSAHISGAHGK